MLKDTPYCTLKQDERAWEIMRLRDQYNNTFTDIAKEIEISIPGVRRIYNKIKLKQIFLYINHLSYVLGHRDTSQMRSIFESACACYEEWVYASAYFEKEYKTILDAYRDGEPGMPAPFLQSMPPFQAQLSKEIVDRVVEMREVEKATYIAIGKELQMTPAKARCTYDSFYHKQALKRIKALQDQVNTMKEKNAIWDFYFRNYSSPKKRYAALMQQIEGPNT